jgi:hypothetical protein
VSLSVAWEFGGERRSADFSVPRRVRRESGEWGGRASVEVVVFVGRFACRQSCEME